ncbi:MAG: ATP-dependent helicase [Tissierellaceae bacterium]|nr:ATP-dependent helicase [Tissierellaceae bacterium]
MELSNEQINSINHIEGPALILAVPGAGKTTVLIHRTYNLIKNYNINPDNILSITFSKASAMDMKNRFKKVFPSLTNTNIHFSTIHAFCFGLIREYAYMNNVNYRLIEDEKNQLNKYALLKKIYLDINHNYITEEKLDSLLNAIGYIKNMMLSIDEFLEDNNVDIENLKTIYKQYENYKRRNNLIDFDDMLTISLEILKSNKYLLAKYRNKYEYIQVDEGQDTSKIQFELIKTLAYPKNNLVIVADDDQSIYGFRGAYPKGLLDFKKHFKDGKIYFMEKNYRSSKNIVSICNKFIKSNTQRYDKNIFTDNKHIEPINIVKLNSPLEQYDYLIDQLKDKDLSSCAILYRNNLSALGIVHVLEKNRIPFYMRDKKIRFFNHWLVNDIINLMIFAQDTSNMEIYETLYYKIKGYISKKQINYAKTLNSNQCVFDRIMDFPGINEYYKRNLRELKFDFKKISKRKPSDAIKYIKDFLEYDTYLRENAIKFGYTYENLNSMLFYLTLLSDECDGLDELISRLKHIQYLCSNSSNNQNTVTLSTIHSAKGLEFENVYMVDLVDGEFPNLSSIESFQKGELHPLEEERRLFYVGMTRAKKHLTLITMNSMNGIIKDPSIFLLELQKS